MEQQLEMERPKESTVLVNYIVKRIKRGLGCNIIVVGAPGLGKSYLCARIGELCKLILHDGEKFDANKHVAFDLPPVFRFVRQIEKPGEPLVVEEASVHASSRRSMATENVSLNYLLDTVRKKQIILMLNAPHLKAVDKHIQRMSHILIDCISVNKKRGYATVKAFKLSNSQDSGKVYKARFHLRGKEVHRLHFYPPSDDIIKVYEPAKSEFMEELYENAEEKLEKKKGKKKENKVTLVGVMPTETEIRRFKMYEALKNFRLVAEKEGTSIGSVHKSVKAYRKKVNIRLAKPVLTPISDETQSISPIT